MPLERIEPVGPVGAIRLQPRVQFHQRFWAEPVQPPLRIAADLHQSGVAQHPQMSRDTRLMHPDQFDQIIDRALAVSNGIEDAPPGRFGNRVKDVESNGHAVNIRQSIYMRNRMYGAVPGENESLRLLVLAQPQVASPRECLLKPHSDQLVDQLSR